MTIRTTTLLNAAGRPVGYPTSDEVYLTSGQYSTTKSLDFSGTKVVNCGLICQYERTDKFSVSVWVKVTNKAAANSGIFVGNIGNDSDSRGWLVGFRATTSTPTMLIRHSAAEAPLNYLHVWTPELSLDNQWHNLVYTYDGSSIEDGMLIYIDSVQGVMTKSGNSLTDTIVSGVQTQIGNGRGESCTANNKLCEVLVINKTLTVTEVAMLRTNGKPCDPRKLPFKKDIAYAWRLGTNDIHPTCRELFSSQPGSMVNMSTSDIVSDAP